MQGLPHQYSVTVQGTAADYLISQAEGLPEITVAPPAQFDGPGDQWSPEELLMAAVANCLVLSFRAISKASKLEWLAISCESSGTLDRVERKTQFTQVVSRVRLVIADGQSIEAAEKLLHKAEETCFVSNSLSCDSQLECEVVFTGENK